MLCFVSQFAGLGSGRWTIGHREQGRNESDGQAKDLQLQKVSVVGFSLELVLLRCLRIVVE